MLSRPAGMEVKPSDCASEFRDIDSVWEGGHKISVWMEAPSSVSADSKKWSEIRSCASNEIFNHEAAIWARGICEQPVRIGSLMEDIGCYEHLNLNHGTLNANGYASVKPLGCVKSPGRNKGFGGVDFVRKRTQNPNAPSRRSA